MHEDLARFPSAARSCAVFCVSSCAHWPHVEAVNVAENRPVTAGLECFLVGPAGMKKTFLKAFKQKKAPEEAPLQASGHKPTPDGAYGGVNGVSASTAVHAVAGLSLEPSHARRSDDAESAECVPASFAMRTRLQALIHAPCRGCTFVRSCSRGPRGGTSAAPAGRVA
jgi:hypothetical protein